MMEIIAPSAHDNVATGSGRRLAAIMKPYSDALLTDRDRRARIGYEPPMDANFQNDDAAARPSGAPANNDADDASPALSVVAPMYNEAGGAAALVDEIAAALRDLRHEIIVVDDCSTDDTRPALLAARARHPQLRVLVHERNAGQSRAIHTGVAAARAPVAAMLDGDGQNDPADIPALYAALTAPDAPAALAMVAGERRRRRDSAAKRWASRFANGLRKRLLKDGANDTGCGLKVFYRSAFLRLPYFDHMHRYLPALMRREGREVAFVEVSHRARAHGVSKYTNLGRLAVGVSDLAGVVWLMRRARLPGRIREEGAAPPGDPAHESAKAGCGESQGRESA